MYEGSLISTSSVILAASYLFDDKPSDSCEIISHCSFDLYFLLLSDAEHLFMHLLASCTSSLGKCLFRSFVHFFFIILPPPPPHWIAWLHAFWLLTYYQIYDLQIFSLILWVAFSFLKLFPVQKVLSLMWSSQLFLLLVSNPKNSCQIWCHGIYFWYFLLGISWFGCHVQMFNLFCIDVCVWCKIGVWLPFLHVAIYFLQHHLLKKLFFLHCILAPLVDGWCANLFLGSLFYPTEYVSVFMSIQYCSDSVQFSHSVMSDPLWLHGPQHAKLPCPSPTPGACSNSYPSSQWCHPTISSSVICFSSCLHFFFTSIRVFSNESVLHIRWPKY